MLITAAALAGAYAAPKAGSGQAAVQSQDAVQQDPPAQVRALLNLLADPATQKWLEKQGLPKTAAAAAAPAASKVSASDYFSSRIGAIREHIVALAAVLPDLPNQFRRSAGLVTAELGQGGRVKVLLLLVVFVALGFGVEWLFRRATARIRSRLDGLPLETVNDRLRVVAVRFAFAAGLVVAFAVGSIGAFLALDWPPLIREMLFSYLLVFLAIRIAIVVGHLLLAPDHERFRICPADRAAARFWYRRLVAFVGWFAFGWVEIGFLRTLGLSLAGLQIVAYVLGLGLMAIALETVWRRPNAPRGPAETPSPLKHHLGRGAGDALLSVGIVVLWVLWVLRAMPGFWLVLVVITLPLATAVTRRAVEHLLRPPGSHQTAEGPPTVTTVCLERGIRAFLIIGAAAVLSWGWGMPVGSMMMSRDTALSRIVHGVLSAVIILLVADVLWQAVKTAIDRKLAGAAEPGLPNTDEARRRARLRTLLPIFRNVLFVVVLVVAVMMALSAMGVQIGPLIAGLGVLGVAIGFGAQSLVRDVIAGVFYLLDDAFRVGEYIQSGNYKGTVESFSFRSVRLRHQRGPLYTVPFALLGAVQNMSRDWVIDKLTVGITYDSDIDKARKLIKQIGLDLAQTPEYAPLILEPLKMQGVDAFGDFAVQIRMKMMTLPGENFVIRRQALAMIKKAFDANGIKFAYPTVQLAGEGDASAAAIAQQALTLTRSAAE